MDTQDLAQDLLAGYGVLAGMPGLKFESHGCARLLFEDSEAIDLEIDHDARCIQVYAVLGTIPAGSREASFYRRLLESNLFGTQTDGATLAIDGQQDEVLLGRRVALDSMTPTGMLELLERFVGVTRQWRHKFASGELWAPEEPAASAATPMDMYVRG